MPKSLVIVESPAKVKTINKFLGPDYLIKASMGHIKDLPRTELGIDVDNGFKPKFVVIKQRKKTVKEIVQAAKTAKYIYLATDPDREGEAIAFHLATEINSKKVDSSRVKRVTFNEITKEVVSAAFANPGQLDINKIEAQQARRILDRLVGYKLSPLLWRKVKRGLSAGRVQSVAVRIICEREEEIEKFKPEEYWTITARLEGINPPPFLAKLEKSPAGKKIKIENETESKKILGELQGATYTVVNLKKEDKKKFPSPPFITSTMQQEASRRFRFTTTRTMNIAQALYEGISVGEEGPVGLITYMRTDSVRVAQEAQNMARKYIRQNYGENFLPPGPPQYKSKKSAQEAHEAIRPTSIYREPEKIKQYLNPEQYRLYKLIWERFLASQMKPATLEVRTIEIEARQYLFRATGTVVKDKGFMAAYDSVVPRCNVGVGSGRDCSDTNSSGRVYSAEAEEEETKEEQQLPAVKKGEVLKLLELIPKQNFTMPPPRHTEASLVRIMEEKGIGRPSTYAPTIQTIQGRRYVAKEKGKFYPTELGKIVNELLVNNFPLIIDVKFTADMEEELDEVEEGKLSWIKVVGDFYQPFSETLQEAQMKIKKVKREEKLSGEMCPKCGSPMVEREGRFGKFFACSGFPKCKYTKSISLGIKCPQCGSEVIIRRTKKGRTFYGCSNYPECKFMSWQKPENRD
ncbi:type I DNA topoisomerase [Candidatus Desantisbacteria bacterium CG_4_10_14_0_8_um_filter_39_17]|uniref:DNA topoisomerase 1 n=1 Tax=Candidatus Desantisbacteria bacterium CG_4_10_14_0_8_um_filter_39_17 TaxID=1974542 RepID=A0A2H9PD31_9BACT|nr:MAG: type I DNA topoisomerase [Candidatus Desantisbacteria bacterium CG_4_10_14_0_8_um_filter_39_17]